MHYKYETQYTLTWRRVKVGSGPFAYNDWVCDYE
jgi:hypothetical protein